MYFCDKEHKQEFKRLKDQRVSAKTSFDIEDYCYAYYLLTADQYLRDTLKCFLKGHPPGEIAWTRLLEAANIREDYRQFVFFAHQLYSGGWDNPDFNFLKLLNSLSQKRELQESLFEACRRYSNKSIMTEEE